MLKKYSHLVYIYIRREKLKNTNNKGTYILCHRKWTRDFVKERRCLNLLITNKQFRGKTYLHTLKININFFLQIRYNILLSTQLFDLQESYLIIFKNQSFQIKLHYIKLSYAFILIDLKQNITHMLKKVSSAKVFWYYNDILRPSMDISTARLAAFNLLLST